MSILKRAPGGIFPAGLVLVLLIPAASARCASLGSLGVWQTGTRGVMAATVKLAAQVRALRFSGSGTVSGFAGGLMCPVGPYGFGNGQASGEARVSGDIAVTGAGGRGEIPVSGILWIAGTCLNGMIQSISGSGWVSGSGPVYGADGRFLGNVTVSGFAMVDGFASSVSGSVSVQGTL